MVQWLSDLEPMHGIEPRSPVYKAGALPLSYKGIFGAAFTSAGLIRSRFRRRYLKQHLPLKSRSLSFLTRPTSTDAASGSIRP